MKKTILTALIVALGLLCICTQAQAADLGKGIALDGYLVAGKIMDVEYTETDTTSTASFTGKKGEMYLETEVGLTYKIIRPFAAYEYLGGFMEDEQFSLKKAGVDVLAFSKDSLKLGVRAAYNWYRSTSMKQDYAFVGLLVKF